MIRILYGSILILFGLNSFFAFLPLPEKQGFALQFLNTLHQARYLFPTIATIMTGAGLLLLLNRWVIWGLLALLPVSFNIFAFHLFHDWPGIWAATVVFGLNIFLILKPLWQKNES